jgi:DNA-binding transcriptional LysR family regulator
MRVASSPGHPLAAAKSVRIEDLADEDWLCGAMPSSCRFQVLQLGRDAGFEPRISFQSEDYQVIKGFVRGGLGVTVSELAGDPGIEPARCGERSRSAGSGRSPAKARRAHRRPSRCWAILREVCRAHRDERKLRVAA